MTLSQHVEPYRTPAPLGIVTSIVIAALGGFVGGLLIEHGPTYLQVHVAQPVLGQPAEPSELGSAPVPADTNRYPEPTTVATPGPTEPHVVASGAESRIVVHGSGSTYLVLQVSAKTDLGIGPIRSSNLDNDQDLLVTMRQAVRLESLTAGHLAWLDAPVTLFDERGYACSGIVEEIELIEQFAGDGFSLETWDEYGGGPRLAARIARSKGACKDAVWGRHAELPAPGIGRISRGSKSERKEARKAFRASEAYRRLQQRYVDEGHTGNWDTFWDGTLTINVIRGPKQELAFVQAQVGGCGEFEGQLGTIFERQDDGTLRALPSDNDFLAGIDAAADVDGDGDLDFVTRFDIYDRALMLRTDVGIHTESRNLVGIYYCRC